MDKDGHEAANEHEESFEEFTARWVICCSDWEKPTTKNRRKAVASRVLILCTN